jgi:hypothetical protein
LLCDLSIQDILAQPTIADNSALMAERAFPELP